MVARRGRADYVDTKGVTRLWIVWIVNLENKSPKGLDITNYIMYNGLTVERGQRAERPGDRDMGNYKIFDEMSDDSATVAEAAMERGHIDTIMAAAWAAFGNGYDLAVDTESDIASTFETVAMIDDSRNAWANKGERKEVPGGVLYEGMQAVKGQRRNDLLVVDCGDIRYTITYYN